MFAELRRMNARQVKRRIRQLQITRLLTDDARVLIGRAPSPQHCHHPGIGVHDMERHGTDPEQWKSHRRRLEASSMFSMFLQQYVVLNGFQWKYGTWFPPRRRFGPQPSTERSHRCEWYLRLQATWTGCSNCASCHQTSRWVSLVADPMEE